METGKQLWDVGRGESKERSTWKENLMTAARWLLLVAVAGTVLTTLTVGGGGITLLSLPLILLTTPIWLPALIIFTCTSGGLTLLAAGTGATYVLGRKAYQYFTREQPRIQEQAQRGKEYIQDKLGETKQHGQQLYDSTAQKTYGQQKAYDTSAPSYGQQAYEETRPYGQQEYEGGQQYGQQAYQSTPEYGAGKYEVEGEEKEGVLDKAKSKGSHLIQKTKEALVGHS